MSLFFCHKESDAEPPLNSQESISGCSFNAISQADDSSLKQEKQEETSDEKATSESTFSYYSKGKGVYQRNALCKRIRPKWSRLPLEELLLFYSNSDDFHSKAQWISHFWDSKKQFSLPKVHCLKPQSSPGIFALGAAGRR